MKLEGDFTKKEREYNQLLQECKDLAIEINLDTEFISADLRENIRLLLEEIDNIPSLNSMMKLGSRPRIASTYHPRVRAIMAELKRAKRKALIKANRKSLDNLLKEEEDHYIYLGSELLENLPPS